MANEKWSGSNPWLGLAPYTEGTPLYGRTKESIQLADIIKDYMASVVFGKSGIGKSSLLSAGISPLLREENYIPVRIRLVHNTDVSYIEQIETKVRETVNCIDRLTNEVSNLGLWDFFHRHSFTTENGIDCIPVIILDQFEEIYTLTDADHKKDIVAFFNELSSLLNDIKPDNVIEEEQKHSVVQKESASGTPKRGIIKRSASSALNYTSATTFRFVICLREDKLYLLERNSANIPSLKANRYNLQALSPESALEVIMCPRPELFSNEDAIAIIDKLADIGDEGIQTIDPAILSLFLYKYYEKKGEANYDNIFADYYQEATKDIKGKSIAFLEDHLLTLGGYRNQVPLDDALSSGVTQEDIQSLLQSIIIRKEQRKGIDYIEFSHDRLCAEAKKNREHRLLEEERRKRRMIIGTSVICAILGLMIIGFVARLNVQINQMNTELNIASVHANSTIAKKLSAEGNQLEAQQLLLETIKDKENYIDDVFESALRLSFNDYDTTYYHQFNELKANSKVKSICINEAKKFLAYGVNRRISIINFETMKKIADFHHLGNSACLTFDETGTFLLSASSVNLTTNDTHPIKIWNLNNMRLHDSIQVKSTNRALFIPNSDCICYDNQDSLIIYDFKKKKETFRFKAHSQKWIREIAVSHDGKYLASIGASDSIIHVWNAKDWTLYTTLHGHKSTCRSIIWSNNSNKLISGSDDCSVVVWDLKQKRMTNKVQLSHIINGLSTTESDSLLLIGSGYDNKLYIYNMYDHSMKSMEGFPKGIHGICYARNTRTIFTNDNGQSIRILQKSRKPICQEKHRYFRYNNLVYQDYASDSIHIIDGKVITKSLKFKQYEADIWENSYRITNDNEITWESISTNKIIHIKLPIKKISNIRLCSSENDGIIFVYGIDSTGPVYFVYSFNSEVPIMRGSLRDFITSNILMEDGMIYFGCNMGAIIEIDTRQRRYRTILEMNHDISGLVISKSKNRLYAASWDWNAAIINLHDKTSLLLRHDDEVNDIGLSDDEQYVVTTSGNTVSIWSEETGNLIISYVIDKEIFHHAYLSNNTLYADGYDGLYKWKFPKMKDLLKELKKR